MKKIKMVFLAFLVILVFSACEEVERKPVNALPEKPVSSSNVDEPEKQPEKEPENTPVQGTSANSPIVTSSGVGADDSKSWWFKRNSTNTPPTAQGEINISEYDAYYLGDTANKVIYLTFDEGYENGFTSKILDILKENDVKAAFFVTETYIRSEPELIKRMSDEGHTVGNHSSTHPDMSSLSEEAMRKELKDTSEAFKEVSGRDIDPFFRPPAGAYSIRSLSVTKEEGYKTIFWSYAYKDWEVDNQPGKQAAYDMFIDNYHNGAIVLLHAVSESNTEALDEILKTMKEKGYVFKTLYELP